MICCCGACWLTAPLISPAGPMRFMGNQLDLRLDGLLAAMATRLGRSSEAVIHVGADEDEDIGELAEALVDAGLLLPAEPSSALICDGCERNCVMPINVAQSIAPQPARAFIVCDKRRDIGRVPVETARLRRWTFSLTILVHVSRQGAEDRSRACRIGHRR
jgi:hypothetical protein